MHIFAPETEPAFFFHARIRPEPAKMHPDPNRTRIATPGPEPDPADTLQNIIKFLNLYFIKKTSRLILFINNKEKNKLSKIT